MDTLPVFDFQYRQYDMFKSEGPELAKYMRALVDRSKHSTKRYYLEETLIHMQWLEFRLRETLMELRHLEKQLVTPPERA